MSVVVQSSPLDRSEAGSGPAVRRLLLVVAVLALLGTGGLDAVLRAGGAPVAAASGGSGFALSTQNAPTSGADRPLPVGVPGVRTGLLPASAPLQSVDGPAPAPVAPLGQHLRAPLAGPAPGGAPPAGSASTWDGRAPPQAAGTFASLPPGP